MAEDLLLFFTAVAMLALSSSRKARMRVTYSSTHHTPGNGAYQLEQPSGSKHVVRKFHPFSISKPAGGKSKLSAFRKTVFVLVL